MVDVRIGSNLYRNTNGAIEIQGVPQLLIALKSPTGPILLSFVVFDESARVMAKLVDSTLAFNVGRMYELTKTSDSLTLKKSDDGKTVLHLEVEGPNRVALREGEFLTVKAHPLQVTSSGWSLNNLRASGEEHDQQGGGVSVGW